MQRPMGLAIASMSEFNMALVVFGLLFNGQRNRIYDDSYVSVWSQISVVIEVYAELPIAVFCTVLIH